MPAPATGDRRQCGIIETVPTKRGSAAAGDPGVDEFAAALIALIQAARRTRGRVQSQLSDLSAAQLVALDAIAQTGLKGVGAVAATIGVAQPTATRTVRTLVSRGLVIRAADPSDARGSVLRLTERGERTLQHAGGLFRDLLGQAWSDMSGTERDSCIPLLRRLTDLLDRLSATP